MSKFSIGDRHGKCEYVKVLFEVCYEYCERIEWNIGM
jgi:hypothetical protein